MATQSQILANRENSKKSHGATSEIGKQTSAQNHTTHGLSRHNGSFQTLKSESFFAFEDFRQSLLDQYQPTNETEGLLINNMAQSHWLANRAQNLATSCFQFETGQLKDQKLFTLYMRYESMHTRAFHKSLTELLKLRAEKQKAEIGFEAHTLKQAAETRAVQTLEFKKQVFEWQKEVAQTKQTHSKTPTDAKSNPASTPEEQKMAA